MHELNNNRSTISDTMMRLSKFPSCNNRMLIIRHGHSLANKKKIIVSSLKNGQNGYGLTTQGRQEVKDNISIAKLKLNLQKPIEIFSSPFLRTGETSHIIADVLNVKNIKFDNRISERNFGSLELTNSANYKLVWEKDIQNPYHRLFGVESVGDVLNRTVRLLEFLYKEYCNYTLLLVTHCDVADILICGVIGKNPKYHRQINSIGTGEIREL